MLISTCKPNCTSKCSHSGEQFSHCTGSRDLGTEDSSPPNYLARATETLFLAILLAWLVRKMKYSPGGRNPIVFRKLEWSRSCEWLRQTFLIHVWRISVAHRLIAELWVQHLTFYVLPGCQKLTWHLTYYMFKSTPNLFALHHLKIYTQQNCCYQDV